MAFELARLLSQLRQLPPEGRLYVAYSGGLDSTVLLHAMTRLRTELQRDIHAIHADHGLQADSALWSEHCEQQCEVLGVSLQKVHLNLQIPPGESLEAVARDARYTAFSLCLQAGDILLTAHHADDQVETVLLQLLRGAGVSGLAGMPEIRAWHQSWLARPLLPFSRVELEQYAVDNALHWMDDASNQDNRFSRNLLRNRVLPELKTRWPGMLKTIGRSARHCASTAKLADELGEVDLHTCVGANSWRLSIESLQSLSSVRQENLLRYWIRQCGLNVPNTHKIRRILSEVLTAQSDSQPLVEWQGGALRRHAGELYLMPVLPAAPQDWLVSWNAEGSLKLPAGLGELSLDKRKLAIPESAWHEHRVQVGFRHTGIKCTPTGRTGRRSFKRLCQDMGIPAWLRPLLPLLLLDGDLVALADYCTCEPYAEPKAQPVTWKRDEWL